MSDEQNASGSDRPALQPQRPGRLGPQTGVRSLQPQRPAGVASLPPRSAGPILPQPQPQRPKPVKAMADDGQRQSPRTPIDAAPAEEAAPAEVPEEEYPEAGSDEEVDAESKDEVKRAQKASSRHPLENSWTFWFDKRPNTQGRTKSDFHNYENNLRHVGEFDSVEDFWRFFNNMKKPSDLEQGSNYHLFKSGVKPMWEDKENMNGGKWTINLKKDRVYLNEYWQNLVLAVIGEALDEGNDVCGCVLARRGAGDRISLWNKNKEDPNAIMKLGKRIKALVAEGVNPSPEFTMEYTFHQESLKTGSSYRANSASYML